MPLNLFSTLPHLSLVWLQVEGEASGSGWDVFLHSNAFNVVLVLLILGFLIKKFNLLSGIGATQQKIESEIEILALKRAEALTQLDGIKHRTENLSKEVDQILQEAKSSAEIISQQILSSAREESGKIVEQAHKRVELEQRAAIKGIEARLLSEALNDARASLTDSLTLSDQRASVEAFLEELTSLKGVR